MNIQTHGFVIYYLPLAVILWRLSRRWFGAVAARAVLLCAGVIFCGWGSPLSLVVLCAEGVITYLLGRAMAKPGARRKGLLAAGAAVLLAVLIFFKYTDFALSLTPLEGLFSPPAAWAPLGLSFLTFQQIFWLRDCYAGEAPNISPLDYACCLTFFATVTCGPITRVGELAPQFRDPKPFAWEDLAGGLYCFALGLGKKVILAGMLANGANYGFARAGTLLPTDAALTILCYTLQIYFDFSGYCDMAHGMARMMGIALPRNFDSPYKALSVRDFWGRWHISLSRFFRSCVYIPLGGNRRGVAVTCRNTLIIFLLSGLWHGAGWGFLAWGALHGCAMILQRLCRGRIKLPKVLAWVLTFAFVNFAWVFFRADSMSQALALLGDLASLQWSLPGSDFIAALPLETLGRLLTLAQEALWPGGRALGYWVPMLLIPAALALLICPNPIRQSEPLRPSLWKLLFVILCVVCSVILFSGVSTFIYANF